MTGPEHYLEAERLLSAVNEYPFDQEDWSTYTTAVAAAAQAHATLALAAATAYPAVKDCEPGGAVDEDARAWAEVTGK